MKKILLILIIPFSVFSQNFEYKFFVSFSDKESSIYNINEPTSFLSKKAIDRRNKHGIEIDHLDLPVNRNYIHSIRKKGFKVINSSRWLNGIIISIIDSNVINQINFPFIDSIIFFGKWKEENRLHKSRSFFRSRSNYVSSLNQVFMIWGDSLHNKGFYGQDMTIAVLDAGFYNVDSLECFSNLFEEDRVLGTYDFVEKEEEVFNDDTHGMSVLSTMAANINSDIMSTAPLANYYLLRTEDAFSENIIEEYNWVCAAEFADSVGVDIINSSLGYTRFDDSNQNYTYKDLDGYTAVSTIGAIISARKGMIVVSSAGNEGSGKWKYISAPADADSILTVGSVDKNRNISSFSSFGPTYDGRVKPSVCAQGEGVAVISSSGKVIRTNGTSFSSPILAGLVACLWQKHYDRTNIEIINAIITSSKLYKSPNDHEGYGLANFYIADELLNVMKKIPAR